MDSGIKWTKPRKIVYSVLEEAKEPLTAFAILERAKEISGTDTFAISTVYRILSTFEANSLITKSSLYNEDTALYEMKEHGHHHYAICLSCHKKLPMKSCPIVNLSYCFPSSDFQVTEHRLEVYGYCKDCRKGLN